MATCSVEVTSSSSSSSDEDERQRLREAVVTDVGIYSYPRNGGIVISAKKPPKPRSEDISDGEEKHPFGTTPEFRAHMRKEFANYLDSILEYKDVHEDSRNILRGPPEGVCPLFTGSTDEPEEIPPATAAPPCRGQSNGYDSSSSSHSSEHERLAQAAVTCEFLFGSTLSPYSQDHTAREENGKKRKKKKKRREKHNRAESLKEKSCNGASSDELTQLENGDSMHEKKKKKKKKKRRKESVEAMSSKSSDSSSDELDQQTADDLQKRKKKKKKKKLKTCEDN